MSSHGERATGLVAAQPAALSTVESKSLAHRGVAVTVPPGEKESLKTSSGTWFRVVPNACSWTIWLRTIFVEHAQSSAESIEKAEALAMAIVASATALQHSPDVSHLNHRRSAKRLPLS